MIKEIKIRMREIGKNNASFSQVYKSLSGIKTKALRFLPDKTYLKLKYKTSTGKKLHLDNPITFNEKLQWMKLYDRNPIYTVMVDKYAARQYVAERIGEDHLIPLLGVWDHPEDIDFKALPNQFVLKCNHNSGDGMCICKDKSKLDIEKVIKGLRKGLSQDYYLAGREWPYKNVPRKIICEQFLSDGTGSLADYKVHNFDGVPKVILVCKDRFSSKGVSEDFFSENWTKLPFKRPGTRISEEDIPRPTELEEMIHLAKILSKGFKFLRTDFYIIQGKVYFGELTLFPGDGFIGFEPDKYDKILGDWLNLKPNERKFSQE